MENAPQTTAPAARRNGYYGHGPKVAIVDAKVPESIAKVLSMFDTSEWGYAQLVFTFNWETKRLVDIAIVLEAIKRRLPNIVMGLLNTAPEEATRASQTMAKIRQDIHQLSSDVKILQDICGAGKKKPVRKADGKAESGRSQGRAPQPTAAEDTRQQKSPLADRIESLAQADAARAEPEPELPGDPPEPPPDAEDQAIF